MASEYLKWKYRDEKPEEKRELSSEEKRKNWWHYYKWHVVIGVVLVGIGINLVCHALGVGQIKPDYQIAYVGGNALPDDTAAAIERTFAALGEDQNGDEQVVVQLNQYPMTGSDPTMAAASQTTLMADLADCESYFFLLEDPEWFQVNYRSLSLLDGSLPEEGNYSAEGTLITPSAWSSPVSRTLTGTPSSSWANFWTTATTPSHKEGLSWECFSPMTGNTTKTSVRPASTAINSSCLSGLGSGGR